MLLDNVKMSEEFIDITMNSICESVVNTHLATLVPFISQNSSIVAKETVEDLNANFEVAVAEAISKKSPRNMFSVIAITKEKFYLEKRFAENISNNCTTKINDLFKSLKQIRVHFFDAGDLEYDYFKRINQGNLYGKSTYKNGFAFVWSDVPSNWIAALVAKINTIDSENLSVSVGCNYSALVQEYYDKQYMPENQLDSSKKYDNFLAVFSSLSDEKKEEVYKFTDECAAREDGEPMAKIANIP